MKVIDTILPAPKTEKEAFNRWINNLRGEASTISGKRIPVKFVGQLPDYCTGAGRATCERQGEHSWFNHSMDTYMASSGGNGLPEGASDE